MPAVSSTVPIQHPGLEGTRVFPVSGKLSAGVEQRVLVCLDPSAEIPLHRHSVNATMYIVAGSGRVLSRDDMNGREVGVGDCVFFEKHALHGFRAGKGGLTFLSENGGIVDDHDDRWDLTFESPLQQ